MTDDANKKPPFYDPDDDPDAPPSAEEVAASQRLRDALAGGKAASSASDYEEMAIVDSLKAAWSPDALHEGVHAEMLDDVPMSAEEIALAEELRESLRADPLVAALQAAWDPKPIEKADHDAIVLRVVGTEGAAGKVVQFKPRRQTRTMRVVTIASTTVLALAASVILWVSTHEQRTETPAAANLTKVRSTQPLFGEPFKAASESSTTSARIDRIAIARASDYRDNRFAKWGVR